jgi:diaminopimelate decarboxylase
MTHPYVATGLKQSKFGIPLAQAMAEYEVAKKLPGLNPIGIHQHIGSQIMDSAPFVNSLEKVTNLADSLRVLDIDIRYINIGGGFGIQYTDEEAPAPEQFAGALVPLLQDTGCAVIMELGRMIAGNAGILVTSVLYNKQGEEKRFVVVDAAMNDLIRPSLYQANHEIAPVEYHDGTPKTKVDIVGPICESSDFLAQDRELPEVQPGDLLSIFSAGAYGFSMSSNYNSRTRVPEILVSGRKAYVIKRRETYDDLIRGEAIPEDL